VKQDKLLKRQGVVVLFAVRMEQKERATPPRDVVELRYIVERRIEFVAISAG
jgi:hypothetical protein